MCVCVCVCDFGLFMLMQEQLMLLTPWRGNKQASKNSSLQSKLSSTVAILCMKRTPLTCAPLPLVHFVENEGERNNY